MPTATAICPFCPLHCDDVAFRGDGRSVRVDCHLARRGFQNAVEAAPRRIGDHRFDPNNWQAFSSQLSLPDCPLVEVANCTVEEAKQLERLHRRGRIRLSLPENQSAAAVRRAIARDGVISATLGDVIARADLIIQVGDVLNASPRLPNLLQSCSAAYRSLPNLSINAIAHLRRLLSATADPDRSGFNSAPQDRAAATSSAEQASGVWQAIVKHRYIAIVLGPDCFVGNEATVAAEMLLQLIAQLNEPLADQGDTDEGKEAWSRRAVLCTLDTNASLRAVFGWRTNRDASSWSLSHQPADIRLGPTLGIDEFESGTAKQATGSDAPVGLQIGGADPGPDGAKSYLPAAVPGVHRSGTVVRGDGSVTLPLLSITESKLESRLEMLCRVLDLTISA